MIIEKIEIESFAAIRGLTLELENGVNLIEGSNESGKSSIADFIKFILYGVSGKGTDGHLPERKRAISYLESHAGGSMTVRVGDRRLRISKNLSVSGAKESQRRTCSIRDLDTGAELYDGREPGELLLGIGESVFVRSAYLRQGGESQLDGADVHNAILNILFSGDERMSVQKAVERIDTARKPLAHKTGSRGRIFELREEISKLEHELSGAIYSNEQMLSLSASLAEKQKINSEHTEKYKLLKARKRAYECARIKESFELLSRAEADKVKAEMEMLELKSQVHIPTEDELDELQRYEISIRTFEGSISDTEKQKSKLLSDRESLCIQQSLVSAIERSGTTTALLSSAESASAQAGRFGILSLVTLLLCACTAGAALAFKTVLIALLALSGAALLSSVILLSLSLSKRSSLRAILRSCECSSVDMLEDALDKYERSRLRMQLTDEDISALDQRLAEYKGLLSAERERLREFLLDMSIEREELSFSEISETLKERARRCAELDGAFERADAYYRGLLLKTEGYDIEKIDEELRELSVADPLSVDIEKTAEQMSFYREQSAALSEKIRELELALTELRATERSPSSIKERISECTQELEASEKRLEALVLAADSLNEAAQELRRGVSPALAHAAGQYMSTLTDGKYGALSLDPSFNLTYEAHGEQRHLDYMSTGTRDSAYLCLRLSLSDIISRNGALPIILDEATAHLDDTRASSLLSLLCKRSNSDMQHILFTCHGRERVLLELGEHKHNYIRLQ